MTPLAQNKLTSHLPGVNDYYLCVHFDTVRVIGFNTIYRAAGVNSYA